MNNSNINLHELDDAIEGVRMIGWKRGLLVRIPIYLVIVGLFALFIDNVKHQWPEEVQEIDVPAGRLIYGFNPTNGVIGITPPVTLDVEESQRFDDFNKGATSGVLSASTELMRLILSNGSRTITLTDRDLRNIESRAFEASRLVPEK